MGPGFWVNLAPISCSTICRQSIHDERRSFDLSIFPRGFLWAYSGTGSGHYKCVILRWFTEPHGNIQVTRTLADQRFCLGRKVVHCKRLASVRSIVPSEMSKSVCGLWSRFGHSAVLCESHCTSRESSSSLPNGPLLQNIFLPPGFSLRGPCSNAIPFDFTTEELEGFVAQKIYEEEFRSLRAWKTMPWFCSSLPR